MTDGGSPFDEDGEWVTSISDDDQVETADDQLVRGTNQSNTSDSSIYREHRREPTTEVVGGNHPPA